MNYFDIHTHIRKVDSEISSVLSILPGDSIPEGYYSVGLHPWFVYESNFEEQLELVREKALGDNCVAIGECGLDRLTFSKSGGSVVGDKALALQLGEELQKKVFEGHIEIANFAKKPLIIHCVRAFPELLIARKSIKTTTPWIIHGFRGSQEIANALTGAGVLLSFGKSILSEYASNFKVREIFKELPADSILLESDNVDKISCEICNIYRAAAEIKGISIDKLQNIIQNNINNNLYLDGMIRKQKQ